MNNKEKPWFMRLTIQNNRTGQQSSAIYPCNKYEMLENLNWCQIPYGSGNYSHLATSYIRVAADSLQEALAGIIENKDHPPSIMELNCLGEQIQRMSSQTRICLEKDISEKPDATIVEIINTAYLLLSENVVYDGISMSGRAVLLGDDEPYFRIQLIVDSNTEELGEEDGIWINCPASESDLESAVKQLGVTSYYDLETGAIYGVIDEFLAEEYCEGMPYTFDEINELARAMKEYDVIRDLGKYKAILNYESYVDIKKASVLAEKLDNYEFYYGEELGEVANLYRNHNPDNLDYEELIEELGFEDTNYGIVRTAGEPEIRQRGPELG